MTDTRLAEFTAAAHPQPAGVVSWSPPQPNWNPWTACNIDEGPLATVRLLGYLRWVGGGLFVQFVCAGPFWSGLTIAETADGMRGMLRVVKVKVKSRWLMVG